MARRWTFFDLICAAHKSGTRSAFRQDWPHGYRLAVRQGLLDSLFPESADKLDKAVAMAKQINNAAEFRKQHPAMARMLHRYGYRNDGMQYEQCKFGCRGSCKALGACNRYIQK